MPLSRRRHIRNLCLLALALLGDPAPMLAAERYPDAEWERVDPESAGWARDKLQKAQAWSKAIKSTAVMVVHRGVVVAEWGDVTARTPLASVRKSLLSALIGNAQARGEINLAQTIGALGIDDNEPSLTAEEKSATVRDLLTGRSGIYHSALYESAAMAAERPPRFSHKPGTFWYYNNWDFNALGTIYERAARSSIFDAFEREIARPIGMQDYRRVDGTYVTGAGSVHAAYPIEMSARDLARFALLYLRGGRWGGRQVVPENWVKESTRPYSHSEWGPGYGYMWWTAPIENDIAPSVRLPEGTFYAAGFGGQFAFVIPAHDLVIVHRAAHAAGGPMLRDIARLLWLLLDSHNISGIGEDASLEAARLPRVGGEMLAKLLAGKTLLYGEKAVTGPHRIRLSVDGTLTAVRGADAVELDTGTWSIRDDKYCRELKKLEPRNLCLTVVSDGTRVQLFDPKGLMFINARFEGD
jgi:CubicO group peptidase (beta-lactamase class C family)